MKTSNLIFGVDTSFTGRSAKQSSTRLHYVDCYSMVASPNPGPAMDFHIEYSLLTSDSGQAAVSN